MIIPISIIVIIIVIVGVIIYYMMSKEGFHVGEVCTNYNNGKYKFEDLYPNGPDSRTLEKYMEVVINDSRSLVWTDYKGSDGIWYSAGSVEGDILKNYLSKIDGCYTWIKLQVDKNIDGYKEAKDEIDNYIDNLLKTCFENAIPFTYKGQTVFSKPEDYSTIAESVKLTTVFREYLIRNRNSTSIAIRGFIMYYGL